MLIVYQIPKKTFCTCLMHNHGIAWDLCELIPKPHSTTKKTVEEGGVLLLQTLLVCNPPPRLSTDWLTTAQTVSAHGTENFYEGNFLSNFAPLSVHLSLSSNQKIYSEWSINSWIHFLWDRTLALKQLLVSLVVKCIYESSQLKILCYEFDLPRSSTFQTR